MWTSLALSLALAAPSVHAFIRFGCSQLVTERFDPLVTPGKVSPHLHQIVGGNAFNLSMYPEDGDISKLATCTTCRFKEDKSNYWTAVLYFKHPNGSFIRVPQMANHNSGPGIQSGGMTVYYFQPGYPSKNLDITSFAPGFRMITGNPMRRSNDIDPTLTESKAVTFRCFQGDSPGTIGAPGADPDDSFYLPNRTCTGGLRSNIYFPQCWDGVNLDSPNHSSHVAHTVGSGDPTNVQFFGTDCPASHPVRLPLLFMEINWDTRAFNDPALWPADGGQPFVFSMGDPTGFGQHADYVFGWEGDSLKRAMDTCVIPDGIPANCQVLTTQTTEEMNSCRQGVQVEEVVEDQYLDKLPGCNPLQYGPGPATMVPECDAVSTTVAAAVPTDPAPLVIPPWPVCNDGPTPIPLAPQCGPATSSSVQAPLPTAPPQ